MFSGGVRRGGVEALEKFNIAEGVPLSMIYMVDDGRAADGYTPPSTCSKKYAGGSTTVTPDPDVIGFCQSLLGLARRRRAGGARCHRRRPQPRAAHPVQEHPVRHRRRHVAQPARQPNHPSGKRQRPRPRRFHLHLAQGPWRGHGHFTPNGTAAAKDSVIQFENVPGSYLFEVKMSDSRDLTEVYRTVEVTLRNPDGTLPANAPPAAHPQSLNANPATVARITLTGTDPEGYPLVFSVTSQPAHGTLTGTAPDLTYTSPQVTSGGQLHVPGHGYRGADLNGRHQHQRERRGDRSACLRGLRLPARFEYPHSAQRRHWFRQRLGPRPGGGERFDHRHDRPTGNGWHECRRGQPGQS
jgi:hypothetical protein